MQSMSAVTARVRVEPIVDPDSAAASQVRALRVSPEQYRYIGDPAFNLSDTLRDPKSEALAVLADGIVVGFYRLDFAPNAVVGRSLGAPSVGLRAFLIDHRHQGRGYGTGAMTACCDDLRRRHADRALLVLTVNCINAPAIAAYRKAGFIDTGELFRGGSAGPQHMMLHSLHPHPTP